MRECAWEQGNSARDEYSLDQIWGSGRAVKQFNSTWVLKTEPDWEFDSGA